MLGDPPWSEDILTESYFRDFTSVDEALSRHPGRKYSLTLLRIEKGVEVFESAIHELSEVVSAYRFELDKESIPTRRTQSTFEDLDTCLRMRIMAASAAAMNLVVYSRRAKNCFPAIENFDAKRREVYSGDPPHEFIQDLRNFSAHYDIPEPVWEFRVVWNRGKGGKDERIDLFINRDTLLQYDDWKPVSREYLSNNERIGINEVFLMYRRKVVHFNRWLVSTFEAAGGEELKDYRRSVAIVEKLRWRVRINLAISRIKPSKKQILSPF